MSDDIYKSLEKSQNIFQGEFNDQLNREIRLKSDQIESKKKLFFSLTDHINEKIEKMNESQYRNFLLQFIYNLSPQIDFCFEDFFTNQTCVEISNRMVQNQKNELGLSLVFIMKLIELEKYPLLSNNFFNANIVEKINDCLLQLSPQERFRYISLSYNIYASIIHYTSKEVVFASIISKVFNTSFFDYETAENENNFPVMSALLKFYISFLNILLQDHLLLLLIFIIQNIQI